MMNSLRTQEPVIDSPLDVIELTERCLGRIDLVERILHRFHQAMGPELEQLEESLRVADLNTIAEIAHRIKGTSLTVAAHGLRDCAEQLEAALHTGCLPQIEDSVAVIGEEWTRVSEMIGTCSQRMDI